MKLTFNVIFCIINGLTDLRDYEWCNSDLPSDVELFDDEMMDVVEKHRRMNLQVSQSSNFLMKHTIPQIQEIRNFLEYAVGFLGKRQKQVWEIWDLEFLHQLEHNFDIVHLHYKDQLE